MNKLGIYIHTPFCTGKCGYCDFYSAPPVCVEQIERYKDALCMHIKGEAQKYHNKTVDTVYFGGGTPTVLGANNLCCILDAVKTYFNVCKDAEITVEANPGDITLSPLNRDSSRIEALTVLRRAGFNRISFGIQSSDDVELRLLSRRHTFSEATQAVNDARQAGFDNLTLDLMYGLPNQSKETWKKSIADIIALNPQHISCYALRLEENVPMYKLIDSLPCDDEVSDLYDTAVSVLSNSGYRQYEVSNFAIPGFESRHNSRYWTGGDYLGFGPAAHSYVSGTRYAYVSDVNSYSDAIFDGKTPPMSEFTKIGESDRLSEYIMLRLRMADGLDFNSVKKEFLIDTSPAERVLNSLIPHGLVSRNGTLYRLTSRGMFVQNSIILELFSALEL